MNGQISEEAARQIKDLLFAGQKIQAIRVHREHSGQGLKESKESVEAMEAELRAREPARFTAKPAGKGCLSVVALGVLAAAGVVMLVIGLSL